MTSSVLGFDTNTGERVELFKLSRLLGLYIIGLQGMGKSGLIENLILDDIKQQVGVAVLDPHGTLIDNVIARLPDNREKDVILLDIREFQHPFGLNLFICSDLTNPYEVQRTVDRVKHVFEKLLGVSQDTPLILEYLENCTYTLVVNPGYTMADISLLLTDKNCRQKLVANVKKPQVLTFWRDYDAMPPSEQRTERGSILRRVNEFLQDLTLPIVGQAYTTIDLQKIMDEGKFLLVKLDVQLDSVTSLIGSLMIALLLNAAYNRPAQRKQFHLYADEFQRFATEDFATLLEEARKFGIGTTIAHQNRGQLNSVNSKLETDLKDRSRSVGNLVVFKINSKDADDLSGEFDITPQPAYEEVLEEERIKIVKPQRHERKEEVIEDGEEEIKTITADPIGWFQQGHSHNNRRVNDLVEKWVLFLLEDARKVGKAFYPVDELLRNINDILVHAKRGELLAGDVPTAQSQKIRLFTEFQMYLTLVHTFHELIKYHNAIGVNDLPVKHDYTVALFSVPPTWKEVNNSFEVLFNSYQGNGQFPQPMLDQLNSILSQYNLKLCFCKEFPAIMKNDSRYEYLRKYQTGVESIKSNQEWNLSHLGERLSRSGRTIDFYSLSEEEESLQSQYWQLIRSAYNDGVWQEWKKEAERLAQQDIQQIMAFITEWEELARLLAAEPIQVSSGQYQPRKRTQVTWVAHESEKMTIPRKTIMHPQRTYADVQAELASELVNLPQFTARVKISDASGSTVEHVIRTVAPAKGLYGKARQDRLERIRANNIRDGYIIDRATVEAEITERQTRCSQQVLQSSLPQPPKAGRKAKPCSSCGFSNLPGANFCSNCGAKL